MAPDKLLAEGDPIATVLFEKYRYARMPNVRLSLAEAAAVLEYVDMQSSAARQQARKNSVRVR